MSKVFQFESPNESSGYLMWKVSNLWQREIKKVLSEFGLTHTQFVIMANTHFLSIKNKDVTQIEIAKHAGIDKMLTSNVLKVLLKKQLIDRKEHKTDTRAKTVCLTKDGTAILTKAVKVVEDFDKIFFDKLLNVSTFNKELINLLDIEEK